MKKNSFEDFEEDIIKSIINDIEYLETLGIEGLEAWESINEKDNSNRATERHKREAFERCGYSVTYRN